MMHGPETQPTRRRFPVLALAVLLGLAPLRDPQESKPAAHPAAGQDAAAAAPAPAQAEEPAFTTEQLEQMLAPIALYPDDLLAQILMAATYPLEIVQADRWVKANPDLKGDAAAKALEAEDWDPSVKSLVAVPDVLGLLSDKLDWTEQLGDAFLGQQADVMKAVQSLRERAHSNGQLETTKDQTVEVKEAGASQTIVIESAEPDVIYVPVYDTTVVYAGWPYPSYPPYPYHPPAWHYGAAIAVGVAWGYAWGNCDWNGGDVDVDIDQNVNFNNNIDRDRYRGEGGLDGGRGNFRHDPQHRGNQPYRDAKTADRFGGKSTREAAASREAFRGRSGGSDPRVIKGGSEGGAAATGDRSKSNWLDSSRAPGAAGDTRQSGRTNSRSSTGSGTRSGAMDGVDRGGRQVRKESQRGSSSRSRAASRGGASRGGAMRGGGGRGGRR